MSGRTAFHHAAHSGGEFTFNAFLDIISVEEKTVLLDIKDNEGETALDIAKSQQVQGMIMLEDQSGTSPTFEETANRGKGKLKAHSGNYWVCVHTFAGTYRVKGLCQLTPFQYNF